MGLAASQARLLFLTRRKSDVEGVNGMMGISNDLLSLSRQSAKLSEQYEEALRAQKVTWTQGGKTSDLTYGLLMGATAAAAGSSNQYILTTSDGSAVILDENYKTALNLNKASGSASDLGSSGIDFAARMLKSKVPLCQAAVTGTGGTGSTGGTTTTTTTTGVSSNPVTISYQDNDVLEAADLLFDYQGDSYNGTSRIVLATGAQKEDTDGWEYTDGAEGAALASLTSGAPLTNALNSFKGMVDDIQTALENGYISVLGESYSTQIQAACNYANEATFNKFAYDINDKNAKDGADKDGTNIYTTTPSFFIDKTVAKKEDTSCAAAKTTNRLVISTYYKDEGGKYGSVTGYATVDFKQLINTFMDYFDRYWAQNYGGKVNGGNTVGATSSRGSTGGTSAAGDAAYNKALAAANSGTAPITPTAEQLAAGNAARLAINNGKTTDAAAAAGRAAQAAYRSAMQTLSTQTNPITGTNAQTIAQNAAAQAGNAAANAYDQDYTGQDKDPATEAINAGVAKCTEVVNSYLSASGGGSSGGSSGGGSGGGSYGTSSVSASAVNFYINIYNAVGSSGWKLDENADNEDYIQAQVLYGNMAIYQHGSGDSWNPISTSDSEGPIDVEEDDTAQTEAEAHYKTEKAKLDYKEKQLDTKMKSLDTERSEITTEIESVQSILKKNIESMKMFEA